MTIARILIIAGSDSGGGAGIQADIKTVTMLGGHAMTAITAITAQNTLGVQAVHLVPTEIVVAQIRSCIDDIGVDAVKIGMIGSAETANAVADVLEGLDAPIVFDPVMVATSGSVLADAGTIAAFGRLMRIATVVTPNVLELRALTQPPFVPSLSKHRASAASGREKNIASTGSARTGSGGDAVALAAATGAAVLAKGGDEEGHDVTDVLVLPDGIETVWTNPRIDTRHSHGTGCTLASGIATGLAQGLALEPAIARAIRFVRAALAAAPGIGEGNGPMGHALGKSPFEALG